VAHFLSSNIPCSALCATLDTYNFNLWFCTISVFGDGTTDARFSEELSLQEKFFTLQDPALKTFQLSLKTTKTVFDGRKNVSASG
jgi:hypothetical protein